MKALTIWQPWASLIMAGAKPYEWRNYPAPKWIVGQRIVIHAGVRAMRMDEIREVIEDIEAGESSLIAAFALPLLRRAHLGLPLASGLGTAVIGTPIRATDYAPDSDRVDHHKWGWPLSDIEPFEPIVPMRGAQGFWNWPAEHAA